MNRLFSKLGGSLALATAVGVTSSLTMKIAYAEEPKKVCPVKHDTVAPAAPAAPGVCPVKHDAVTPAAPAAPAVCPVKHDATSPAPAAPAVCPVKHDAPKEDQPAVCPMRKEPTGAASHGSSFLTRKKRAEPTNEGGDHYVKRSAVAEQQKQDLDYDKSRIDYADEIPGGVIPASGRGNSEDGAHWVNPTPAELFRALRRNNKIIDEEDAYAVAFIHSAVVDTTWDQIMQYEALHAHECDDITLNRFEGKYGHHTVKSWLTANIVSKELTPFDRHDWWVNRCGKEVRYIIDYYSVPNANGEEEYFIDTRPDASSFSNIKDRVVMAHRRYKKGEPVW